MTRSFCSGLFKSFFSNTIKHSKARQLRIELNYGDEILTIDIIDDGVGFNLLEVEKGSGLLNMKGRAKLIDTNLLIESSEKGTAVILRYPLEKKKIDEL